MAARRFFRRQQDAAGRGDRGSKGTIMGTITSGIGLVSGINTSQIIDQLMQIEQQPVTNLQARVDAANKQKLALVDLSTSLASIKLNTATLNKPSTFTAATATSSNESVLTATTTGSPTPGSYQFQVARLVTTQQAVSNGFANYSTSLVGAGTITIEQGGGDLTSQANLSQLNGGAGVRRGQFRITDRSGHSAVVDISAAVTLDDVVKKINTTFDVSVRASISKDGLQLTDLSGGTGSISVQDVGGGNAAADLGLVQSVNGSTLTGTSINGLGRATLLSQLNDGRGVRTASSAADFRITFGDGSTADVNLSAATTVGDTIDAINTAAAGKLQAAIGPDGHSLQLTDLTGSGTNFTVAALNGSSAAADLGIAGTANGTMNGQWVVSSLNSVLLSTLNGGKGFAMGSFTVTNRNGGGPTTIDLSSAKTVQDVLDTINGAGAGVTASLKASGNGIQLTDTSGGSGNLVIADAGGSTVATSLGIAGTFTSSSVQGANLQRQWVTENSLLSTYNGGKGVGQGIIKITNSTGISKTVDLTSTTNPQRIGDVIKAINAAGAGVTASINDHGDGILLTDTAGGPGKMIVEDQTGTAAADLNIKGDSGTGTTIDGSFEKTIDVTATDTLATLQTKIQSLNFGVGAQIINDGTADAPYRLSMTAKNTGRAGRVVLDMGTTSVAAQNLVDAQDAAVFVGGSTDGSAQPLLITASRNQIAGVISGVSIDLHAASSSPVTLDVSRTTDTATTNLQQFTDGFNAILDKIADLTKFDPSDPSNKGILLGDSTVQSVSDQMYQALNAALKEGGRYKVLSDVGLTIGDGGKLEFDSDKFNAAYSTDPDSVQKLFTYLETTTDSTGKEVTTGKGLGYVLENAITKLIDPVSGLITRENQTLDSQTQGFNDRITQLNGLLDQKRTRLEMQFANMESVLSQLQSQQSSLSQIKSISYSSSSSSSSSS